MDERFKEIIVEGLKLDNLEKITDEATFDSLGADSLDTVEISMLLEDEYKMVFPDDYKPANLGRALERNPAGF
ncbi:MAG: phosphopantetheine-binding protein [Candidatus Nanoarchaeia archaeon]|nr:phosphopantetheine-binding protein [Candidatus Nanoarchaeia archaeon]MDD5741745.1 phosphopantetheine-binding protein [Candidatus Nanoarchaeia archaeon]